MEENKKQLYIHEIKLGGESDFAKKFNHISDLYARSQDKALTQEERDEA